MASAIYLINSSNNPATISNYAGSHIILYPGIVTQVDSSYNWQLPNFVILLAGPNSPAPGPTPTAPIVLAQPVMWQDVYGQPFGTFANPINANHPGSALEVVPTVTVGSYTSGYVIGGIMHFTSILPLSQMGMLESLALKFKGTVQTVEFDVALFSASPAGTFADHGAPVIAVGDTALLIGIFALTANMSSLGTHTIYRLDGITREIVNATSRDLWAVVTAKSAPVNPASSSDMSLRIGLSF